MRNVWWLHIEPTNREKQWAEGEIIKCITEWWLRRDQSQVRGSLYPKGPGPLISENYRLKGLSYFHTSGPDSLAGVWDEMWWTRLVGGVCAVCLCLCCQRAASWDGIKIDKVPDRETSKQTVRVCCFNVCYLGLSPREADGWLLLDFNAIWPWMIY